ncbi:MAG: MBOAT family O-acyltransferase [Phaeospirillum sp.]|nr:MBOAT family O-acyltransferase [Phaeospirillum sp.]
MLLGSILFNYALGLRLSARPDTLRLGAGIAVNLGLLLWFKYAGVFIAIAARLGFNSPVEEVMFPLAISFFTFRQISYLVDINNKMSPPPSFTDYLFEISFFPCLIAGPLIRHLEIAPQLKAGAPRPSWEDFAVGSTLFTIGLVKKVILSETMMVYSDKVFESATYFDQISFVTAWVGALAYGLQIYFDFSGYSDMAIGVARIFGITLPLNFNSPYKSGSMVEFWQRWHMTLTRFFTTYLYNPIVMALTRRRARQGLGTSPRDLARPWPFLAITASTTMFIMTLMGVWHGNNALFAVFGAVHGLYLVVNRAWRIVHKAVFRVKSGALDAVGGVAGHALTLLAVTAAWGIFRAASPDAALRMMSGMAGLNGLYLPEGFGIRLGMLAEPFKAVGWRFGAPPDSHVYPTLTQLGQICALLGVTLFLPNSQEWLGRFAPALTFKESSVPGWLRRVQWRPGALSGVTVAIVFVVSLVLIHVNRQTSFVYFQF